MKTALIQLIFALSAVFLSVVPGIAMALWLPTWLQGRALLGPLLGLASAAWIIQLGYYLFAPAWLSVIVAFGASAGLVAARHRVMVAEWEHLRYAIAIYICCFLGSLFATSVSVWPAAGPWAHDWHGYLGQLQAIAKGDPLGGGLLARPPLFAAACVPFHFLFDALPAVQIGACGIAAASLAATLWAAEHFTDPRSNPARLLWVVGVSAFYLVNLTAVVPKLMQGALIVSAFVMLRRSTPDQMVQRLLLATVLISLALESHHSTIAYALAFCVAIWHLFRGELSRSYRLLGACVGVLVVLVAIPETLRILRFGVKEIIAFNPSYGMRSPRPVWIVFLLNLESTVVGWAYVFPLWDMIKCAMDPSWQKIGFSVNFLTYVHMGMMANTLLQIVIAGVFTLRRAKSCLSFVGEHIPLCILLGLATVPVINAVLHPYEYCAGIVHAGNTALALGWLALAMAWLCRRPQFIKGTIIFTLLAGTLPWLLWNVVQYWIVMARGGFLLSGPALERDNDIVSLLESNQIPWGYGCAPWLPILLVIITLVAVRLATRYGKFRHPLHVRFTGR